MPGETKKSLEQIAGEDGRYAPGALQLVYEGLGYTIRNFASEPGHVSGQTLCEGLRRLAVEKWGRMAMLVLNTWGVKTTQDFGEIVYLMIEHKWMSAQPTDAIGDFNNVYDLGLSSKTNSDSIRDLPREISVQSACAYTLNRTG